MKAKYIYGIDFGGSLLRIGKFNLERGKLEKVISLDARRIMTNEELLKAVLKNISNCAGISISAAGNIDEDNSVILESPNSKIPGQITFAKDLREKLGSEVVITNDMRAAVHAAARFDAEGSKYDNVCVATYSSGFNAAVARERINVSCSELGHIMYKPDSDLFCGCKKRGHLEVFVSGNGAASMARQYFGITKPQPTHLIIQNTLKDFNNKRRRKIYSSDDLKDKEFYERILMRISARNVYDAYKEEPEQSPQKEIRNTQVKAIAHSFGVINSSFNPLEIIVCMGGQTKSRDELFNPAINLYAGKNYDGQLPSINVPIVTITSLEEIGILGAVSYFLTKIGK